MAKIDPVETLAKRNCASIAAHYAAQSTTALQLGPMGAVGRRNVYSPLTGGFKCKTCGKVFSTFQALGGHVSSHAKHSFDHNNTTTKAVGTDSPAKNNPKFHECGQCHVRFATGQALGGHMRRHFDLSAKRKHDHQDDAQVDQEKKIKTEQLFISTPLNPEGDVCNVKTESFKERILLLDLNLPPVDQETVLDS